MKRTLHNVLSSFFPAKMNQN